MKRRNNPWDDVSAFYHGGISVLKIAICDDEPEICQDIERRIREIEGNGMFLDIRQFLSGEELLESIGQGQRYHIIFLDYEMQGIDGRRTGVEIRERYKDLECLLIYVSSHEHMVIQLLDADIFRFIVKPIHQEHFRKVYSKARDRVVNPGQTFCIKTGWEKISVSKNDIFYVVSDGRKVCLTTKSGSYSMYARLDEVAKEFEYPGSSFIRIHKSYLINFIHCQELTAKKVIMKNGTTLEVSRGYRESYKNACLAQMGKG